MKRQFATSLITSAMLLVPGSSPSWSAMSQSYAHRGGPAQSGLIENTVEAFNAAAGRGVLNWETDVRFTRTDYPILAHDETLPDFGCPKVTIVTVSVTKAQTCLARSGQRMSTLYEFVAAMKTTGANAFVELKTVPSEAQWRMLDVRLASVKSRVVIQSFSAPNVAKAVARGYKAGLLSKTNRLPSALPKGSTYFFVDYRALTQEFADKLHSAGFKVVTWTPTLTAAANQRDFADAFISDEV